MELKPNAGYITDSLGGSIFNWEIREVRHRIGEGQQLTPDDSTITEHLADGYAKLNRGRQGDRVLREGFNAGTQTGQTERLRTKIRNFSRRKK